MAELSQAITRAEEGSSKLAAAEEEHSMLVKTLETKLFETQEELKRIKEEGKAALVAQGEILKQAEADRKRELDEARRRNVAELEAKGEETDQWKQEKLKEVYASTISMWMRISKMDLVLTKVQCAFGICSGKNLLLKRMSCWRR